MALDALFVNIGAQVKDFNEGLNKISRDLDKMGTRMKSVGRSLTVGLTAPLLAIGGAAIKMAADAEESENLFTVSMGNMEKEARTFSESLRKQFGLNAYEVRKQLGIFNTMIRSMGVAESQSFEMSKGLAQLTNDMASFNNLKTEEAFQKLRAGISGESEPLKQLGIIINETSVKAFALNSGIIKQGETMTEAQKVAARYGLIMERTRLMQGDLGRTMNSSTNLMRRLSTQIKNIAIDFGTALLPMVRQVLISLSPLVGKLGELVTRFKESGPALKAFTVLLGSALAALGPFLFGVGTMMKMVAAIQPIMAAGAGAIIGLIMPLLAAAAAFGSLLVLGARIRKNFTELKSAFKEVHDSAKEWLVDKFGGVVEGASKLWRSLGSAIDTAVKFWKPKVKVAADAVKNEVQSMADDVKEQAPLMFNDFKEGILSLKNTIMNSGLADSVSQMLIPVMAKFEELGLKMGFTKEQVSEAMAGINGVVQDNLPKTGLVVDEFTQSISGAFVNMSSSMVEAMATGTGDITKLFSQFLIRMMNMAVEFVITQLGIFQALAAGIKAALSNPFTAVVTIGALIGAVAGLSAAFKKKAGQEAKKGVPALASGGIVTSPTLALVGEAGPEAVVPLSRLGSMGGGKNQTIQILLDGRTLTEQVVQGMPEFIRMNGGNII